MYRFTIKYKHPHRCSLTHHLHIVGISLPFAAYLTWHYAINFASLHPTLPKAIVIGLTKYKQARLPPSSVDHFVTFQLKTRRDGGAIGKVIIKSIKRIIKQRTQLHSNVFSGFKDISLWIERVVLANGPTLNAQRCSVSATLHSTWTLSEFWVMTWIQFKSLLSAISHDAFHQPPGRHATVSLLHIRNCLLPAISILLGHNIQKEVWQKTERRIHPYI